MVDQPRSLDRICQPADGEKVAQLRLGEARPNTRSAYKRVRLANRLRVLGEFHVIGARRRACGDRQGQGKGATATTSTSATSTATATAIAFTWAS